MPLAPPADRTAPAAAPSAGRVVTARVLALLFALSWLVFPGFGVPDLAVSWNPAWAVVLEAGWGLFSTVLVAAALLRLAWRPRTVGAVVTQLAVAVAALAVAALLSAAWAALVLVALLAVQVAVVVALLHPDPRTPLRPHPSLPLLAWSLAGAVGGATYAVAMAAAARADQPVDVSVGVDHYVVQAALALAVPGLAVLAAVAPAVRAGYAVTSALSAGYLGLVVLCWQGKDGGYGRALAALTVVWAIGLVALALLPHRADARRRAAAFGDVDRS
ncbi:MAG: hypothetical protein ACTHK1_06560 [Actinomycetales bacterium]